MLVLGYDAGPALRMTFSSWTKHLCTEYRRLFQASQASAFTCQSPSVNPGHSPDQHYGSGGPLSFRPMTVVKGMLGTTPTPGSLTSETSSETFSGFEPSSQSSAASKWAHRQRRLLQRHRDPKRLIDDSTESTSYSPRAYARTTSVVLLLLIRQGASGLSSRRHSIAPIT